MCGLASIISFDSRQGVDGKTLAKMAERIAHRGPDASGTWEVEFSSPSFAAGLAHCRLSILDLDSRANQPMSDSTGRFTIVFNGEIYNYRELRKELETELPSFRYRTTSDTEVIIAAFQLWGEKCVERLEGMFAFVIVDQANRTVFAARDRMGQKPLYLAAISSDKAPLPILEPNVMRPIAAVAFASEIGAVLAVPWVDRKLREQSLAPYLMWGYVPSPHTFYEGVYSLPAGHAMTIALQQARVWRYFDPNEARQRFIPGETDVDATRRLVLQAVKRQLVADVPVGCFLSGGMDSSIIAAAMRQVSSPEQEILTFSIGFDDKRFDETGYAKSVADHLKTRHQTFHVALDAIENLNRIVGSFGQPFADSSAIPTYHLSQVTRKMVKVALSGDGGDELFGGYDRYRAVRLAGRMHPALRYALSLPVLQALPGSHPKSRLARFKRFLQPLSLPAGVRYARYMELFSPADLARIYLPERAQAEEAYLAQMFQGLLQGRDDVPAALATDRLTYLPEDLLVKLDRSSMQHALEVRSPFMDTDLVQFAAGLDTAQLIGKGSKTLLRKAFSGDLPPGHFDRPKMGFAVPIGEWLRTDLREMLYDYVNAQDSFAGQFFDRPAIMRMITDHEHSKRDHSQRLYALLVLELWKRKTERR